MACGGDEFLLLLTVFHDGLNHSPRHDYEEYRHHEHAGNRYDYQRFGVGMERLQRRGAQQKHHANAVVFTLDISGKYPQSPCRSCRLEPFGRIYRGFFLYQRGVSAVHAERLIRREIVNDKVP